MKATVGNSAVMERMEGLFHYVPFDEAGISGGNMLDTLNIFNDIYFKQKMYVTSIQNAFP